MWTYEQTEQYLMRLASDGIFQIFYSDLYSLAGVNRHDDVSRNAFDNMLGKISANHFAKNLPLLSVIVVRKSKHERPGLGFFRMARQSNPAYIKLTDENIFTLEVGKVQNYVETYTSLLQDTQPSTYLLTWNPRRFAWDDFQDDWDAVYMGYRPRFRWSCGNTKSIKVGDRVFLMRLGWREKITGIVTSGHVTKSSFEEPHWNDESGKLTALYIEFEPDVLLNPQTDELLNPKLVSQDFNWHPQSSGITIPREIAAHLEQVWQSHVRATDYIGQSEKIDEPKSGTYTEGGRKFAASYRYERDPNAREDCIRHFGTQCVVCGFDFGETFGVMGEGFIHIHHLTPISERVSEYTIDPIEDLRPVCPNCHAMLHRRSPPYSIDELKHIRQKQLEMND